MHIFTILKFIAIAVVLVFSETNQESSGESSSIRKKHHETSHRQNLAISDYTINDYLYRLFTYEENGDEYFEILHKGKMVFRSETGRFYGINTKGDENIPPAGKDITGDGIPDHVVEGYSGGAHCCYSYLIFSLGKQFKKITHLQADDSPFTFKDIDGDGIYEITGRDCTFAYWETCFAASPAPEIILQYKDNKYKLAGELMINSHPELTDEFNAKLETVKNDPEWLTGVPPSLWEYMLDLIYAGNSKLAYKFFGRAWQGNKGERNNFIIKFKKQLSMSPYWHEIKRMNRKGK
ncbi:MAG: hypothetical protein HYV59_12675 [Planctomycetes bacterium]|nr:hypothetical protein [Planctomycetota bacterium]